MKILPRIKYLLEQKYMRLIDEDIGNQAPTSLDANIGKQIRSLNENIES